MEIRFVGGPYDGKILMMDEPLPELFGVKRQRHLGDVTGRVLHEKLIYVYALEKQPELVYRLKEVRDRSEEVRRLRRGRGRT